MTLHLDESIEPLLSWAGVMDAIVAGHRLAPASTDDSLLRRDDDALLSRAAFLDGLGALVKTATVFPGNAEHGRAAINGQATLFADATGEVDATIDFHLLTKWKTAADSALAASRLARPHARRILIVGSGAVAASMVDAYRSVFDDPTITIWSRTPAHARRLAAAAGTDTADDLAAAVGTADVVCTATMATEPLVHGRWLRPGQHVDLIGGYRHDMREADDAAVSRSTVFVDSVRSALDVGDVAAPVERGLIDADRLVDLGGLADGSFARSGDDEITICKNAGGAHLDLMVARHMFERSSDRTAERC